MLRSLFLVVSVKQIPILHSKFDILNSKVMSLMQQIFMMNIESMLKDFAAFRTFHKSNAIINMRIPDEVLDKVKEIAATQGVPYQSLISSILFSLVGAKDAKAVPQSQYAPAMPNMPGEVAAPPMTGPGPMNHFNPAMPAVITPTAPVIQAVPAAPIAQVEPIAPAAPIAPAVPVEFPNAAATKPAEPEPANDTEV